MVHTPQVWSDAEEAVSVVDQANEVRESVARVAGVGTAARGDVRVTVGMGGRLTGVVIAGRAMELSGEALCAEIMTAASLAEQDATREVHSVASRWYPDHEMWRQYTGE